MNTPRDSISLELQRDGDSAYSTKYVRLDGDSNFHLIGMVGQIDATEPSLHPPSHFLSLYSILPRIQEDVGH